MIRPTTPPWPTTGQSKPWRLQDCSTVPDDTNLVFVGVHRSQGELERHERARAGANPERPPHAGPSTS
ncbi:hypothetical protein [Lentzea sp.]|uniref:hypothetical protein n=1 Tax=Lentzea sp. TaxID=56099 RepID=UPI002C50D964|nr:hypothetical protein [Lentzea sp.]HUQ60168.1 hypothetical protein [Lentzea sp.]